MQAMLEETKERVYLSLPEPLMTDLKPALRALVESGRKVVVLAPVDPDLPGAQVYLQSEESGRIRLIADSSLVLTGQMEEDGPTCLYSGDRHLVDLIKDAMRREMEWINEHGPSENTRKNLEDPES